MQLMMKPCCCRCCVSSAGGSSCINIHCGSYCCSISDCPEIIPRNTAYCPHSSYLPYNDIKLVLMMMMINSDHDNNNNVSTEYGDGCGRIGLDVNSNAAPFQQQPQQETAHLRPSFFAPWQSEYGGGAMNHSPFSNWVFRVIDNNCKKI